MDKEFVTYEEVSNAYFDCRKHKRNKRSSMEYEVHYEMNNYELYRELNEGRYEVGESYCFCVTKPKLREVFAASFRDRIVHHLLMNRFLRYFESEFIDSTYNCRVGKGVLYGVNDIKSQAEKIGKDCWYLKVDLSGFFMSIDKEKLWEMTEKMIRERWDMGDNLDRWLELLKKVTLNRPEQKCVKKGDLSLWNKLEKSKSLFYTEGKGLPIGNLTSQILANFYLTGIDKWLSKEFMGYGRYVDDIVMLDTDKKKLLKILNPLREKLGELNLKLNEKKTIIQRVDKGIAFTGYIIQPWGTYIGKNLKYNAIHTSKEIEPLEKHIQRINSYFGFCRHALSYGIRYKIWNNVKDRYGDVYGLEHLNCIKKIKKK